MLAIRDINQTPPQGWSWTDPQTKFAYNLDYGSGVKGLENLMEHVRRYREDNMLPAFDPAALRKLIEHSICKRDGMENRCFDASPQKRNIGQTIKGGMAAVKAIAGSFIPGENEMSMVSVRLAEKRAAVCDKCPMNNKPDGQTLLEQLEDAAMLKLIGSRKTSIHDRLLSCSVCTCNVRAKVWFSRRIINGSLDAETRGKLAKVVTDRNGASMACWQIRDREPQ